MGELRRLLVFLKPYWRRMAIAIVLLILSSALGLVLPLVVRGLIDTVLGSRNYGLLNRIVLGLVGVFILQSIFSYGRDYELSYVGERIVANLRRAVYAQLMRLSLGFYATHSTGELVSRVTNDVTMIQQTLTSNLVSLISQALTLIGGVVIIFALDWRLTLILFLAIPIVVVVAGFFGRRLRGFSMGVQDRLAEATGMLDETISGIRIVKSFAREPYEVARFDQRVDRTFSAAMDRVKARVLFVPLISFTVFAAIALVIWYGGRQVITGAMTPGSLVAYLLYAIIVAGPIGTFTTLYAQTQEALGATRRVFELLDSVPEIQNAPDAIPLPAVKGYVQFEDVDFSYQSNDPVLRDVSLEVLPGEVAALVGHSGAGKTTLVNLIPRFYDPVRGRVLVDGHDLRSITLESLRGQIGIVPQESILFAGTIRENIAYGRLDASEEEIIAAARAANAHQFISEFPDGYDAVVGERGVKLSGGERQRLSIARAILKNPRILILDEATSSLDTESERLVQEALQRLMASRTTFVIAHRLSTVHNANKIITIEEGRVVEMGSHAELMARGGLYARLYALQFAAPKENNPAPEEAPVSLAEDNDQVPGAVEDLVEGASGLPFLAGWGAGKARTKKRSRRRTPAAGEAETL